MSERAITAKVVRWHCVDRRRRRGSFDTEARKHWMDRRRRRCSLDAARKNRRGGGLWRNGSPVDRVDRQCKQTREVSAVRKKQGNSLARACRKASIWRPHKEETKVIFWHKESLWTGARKGNNRLGQNGNCVHQGRGYVGRVRKFHGEKRSAKKAEVFCCQVGLL